MRTEKRCGWLLLLSLMLMPLTGMAGNLTQLVNPRIGTGGHGHVFVGANVPFGMIQLGPNEHTRGWDWCSGYHESDSVIIGFGHMHLSGTGIGELGDVAFLPVLDEEQREVLFSHRAERVRPGYYSVMLDNHIHVELTATERAGMHRYTLPADAKNGFMVLNLNQGIGWDKMSQCGMKVESATLVTGFRYSTGWAKDQKVFFAAEFSRPVKQVQQEGDSLSVFSFDNNGSPLLLRVGLSAVSVEGAKANLRAEMNHWNFASLVADADRKWEEQLQKMHISGGTPAEQSVFYTAMYHTMIAPSVFCDVDGRYRGADGQVYQGDFTNYTTFSLWDTYRAAHPLMTLIHPERQKDIAQTMLHICDQQGKLPVWHLMGNETDCMVGNPGSIALADLVMKGYLTDYKAALEALKKSDMREERGLGLLAKYGYIPCDLDPTYETVAKGLEYAIADGAAAVVAKRYGTKSDYKYFYDRSQSYRRYFDRKTGFMRGVTSKGQFREPFNPFHAVHQHDDYTEGNAWQYTWLVSHDVHGLIGLFGGEKPFLQKLDSLFVAEGDLGEGASPDISGLIGQYAHGNEPSHHIIYMYNYAGQPWKAAPLLRKVFSEMYRDGLDGLSGNEDVGQMSAWYVLSSMGLYQVEPAGGRYIIGSPLFDSVEMNVGNGRTFKVTARNNSAENIYVQSAKLNGKKYTKSYVDFKDIVCGGELELVMGSQPSAFGTAKKDRP
ncbi:MAG: GH92 family glycosyl hydrolase [Prevotella sp.]|nr:GH92 family glycosyl hydrolase [Prevotella sp.]